jgi:hypothetical protein
MKQKKIIVGPEILTAVVMTSPVFWNITLCSPVKVNRHFRGTCRLLFQLCLLAISRWFLAWLIIRPWRWKRHVPPKLRLAFNGCMALYSRRSLQQSQNSHCCTGCGRCQIICVLWKQRGKQLQHGAYYPENLGPKGFRLFGPLAKIITTHVNSRIKAFNIRFDWKVL